MRTCSTALGLLVLLSAAGAGQLPRELLAGGDFERDGNADGWPDGWGRAAGARWLEEGGNHFLRLQAPKAGQSVSIGFQLPLEADWGVVRLSCRARWRDVVRGFVPPPVYTELLAQFADG